MPLYKLGIWDGKYKFFNFKKNLLGIGLLDDLLSFLDNNEIEYILDIEDEKNVSKDTIKERIDSIIKQAELPFKPRDYQYKGIIEGIFNKKCILVSATSSGKSLMIYIIMLYNLKYNQGSSLLIVPSINLVEQMYADFIDYGIEKYKANTNTDIEINRIYSGTVKNLDADIIISTWQSLMNKDITSELITKNISTIYPNLK